MVDQKTKEQLLLEVHKSISESSKSAISTLSNPEITYPVDVEFSENELIALKNLNLNDDAKSALNKIITDSCAYPIFHLCNLFDGVTEPEGIEEWYGVSLTQKDESDDTMLHDEFFESFNKYRDEI